MSMHNPAHPGEILKELVLGPLNVSIKKTAIHLGISRKTLSKIVNCKGAITPEMATRLELLFQTPEASHWLKLQNAYDLWQTKQHISEYKVTPFEVAVA